MVHPNVANSDVIAVAFTLWVALLTDSPLEIRRGARKPSRVIRKFRNQLIYTDLATTLGFYSDLGERLMNSPRYTPLGSSQGPYIPSFQKTPIFQEYLEWYRSGDPQLMQYLLTFCFFCKKIRIEDDGALLSNALRDWKDLEAKLGVLALPELTRVLKAIVSGSHLALDRTVFFPKCGPGFTADSTRGLVEKSRHFVYDEKIHRTFYREHSFIPGREGYRSEDVIPHIDGWTPEHAKRIPSALRFVPKTYKSLRTICMEPNVLMYHQQGVYKQYMKGLEKTPLRRYVHIDDQTENQCAARYGSETARVDTIDLSSASDSVHVDLVKSIFPASLLRYLLGTRSSEVSLPDGDVVHVHKFAPMGSALCFPIQTTIFLCVCIYGAAVTAWPSDSADDLIEKFTRNLEGTLRLLFKPYYGAIDGLFEPIRVYGDDIIVDTKTTTIVIQTLTSLGFTVNQSKSFVADSAYRESCGKHYCWGEDVTPVLFKVSVHDTQNIGADEYDGLIDFSNILKSYRLMHTRRVLLRMFLHHMRYEGRKIMPKFTYDPADRGILVDKIRYSGSYRIRYNRGLQRAEVRCMLSKPARKRKPGPQDVEAVDLLRYVLWWRAAVERGDSVCSEESIPDTDAVGRRVGWGWTPIH